MSSKAKKTVLLVYGILLSILLVVSGILLAVSCVNIYLQGDRPFTPDAISTEFQKIQVVIYVTLGAVAIGALLKIFMPVDQAKRTANMALCDTLKRLESRYDIKSCTKSDKVGVSRAKKWRTIAKTFSILPCVILSIPVIIVALVPANYTMEYNQSIIDLCILIIPCFLLCAIIFTAYSYVEAALLKKQIAAFKALIAEEKIDKRVNGECSACKRRKERYAIISARIIVAVIALIFIVLGIANGGMEDVLSKAINICTECIGLG